MVALTSHVFQTQPRRPRCTLFIILLLLPSIWAAQVVKSPKHAGSTSYEWETTQKPTETVAADLAPTTTPKPPNPGDLLAEKAFAVLKQLPNKYYDAKGKPTAPGVVRRMWQRLGRSSSNDEQLAALDADLAKLRKLEEVPEVKNNDAPHLKRAKAVRMLEVAAQDMESQEAAFMLGEINFVRM